MIRKHRHLLVAMAALPALLSSGAATANNSWGNYHWARTTNPFPLTIQRQITPTWDGAFSTAVSDWGRSTVLTPTAAGANAGVSSKRCTAIAGKVLVCNDYYGQRGWLGIASIWADSNSHITQATTKLNDSYFDTATYNKPEWRALVTCQEIGHDFGLAHQDESFTNANLNTCMDYTNSPLSNQHPNQHDFDQLATIYGHGDSYPTWLASTPTIFATRTVGGAGGNNSNANDPGDSAAEWGTAIHRDGLGRPDQFVKQLGGGMRKITHVFWAPK